jgi:hypothetical protein
LTSAYISKNDVGIYLNPALLADAILPKDMGLDAILTSIKQLAI